MLYGRNAAYSPKIKNKILEKEADNVKKMKLKEDKRKNKNLITIGDAALFLITFARSKGDKQYET